jgi:hypothetical protein
VPHGEPQGVTQPLGFRGAGAVMRHPARPLAMNAGAMGGAAFMAPGQICLAPVISPGLQFFWQLASQQFGCVLMPMLVMGPVISPVCLTQAMVPALGGRSDPFSQPPHWPAVAQWQPEHVTSQYMQALSNQLQTNPELSSAPIACPHCNGTFKGLEELYVRLKLGDTDLHVLNLIRHTLIGTREYRRSNDLVFILE